MMRQSKFVVDTPTKSEKVHYFCVVLDLLYHTASFARVLSAADPLDIIGSENERLAFLELKSIIFLISKNSPTEPINIQQFINKLDACTYSDYTKNENVDVSTIWDDIVKLIMVVIPPLREVFLGQVANAQEVPGWLNLMSRCFKAQFTGSLHSLEDIFRASTTHLTATSDHQRAFHADGSCASNAMVLKRAPEILVITIESFHLRSLWHQIPQTPLGATDKMASMISFPATFDLATMCAAMCGDGDEISRVYDLTSVVALEGPHYITAQSFFRVLNISDGGSADEKWFRGAGQNLEEVSRSRAVEGNYYTVSIPADRRIHPRLLVYTRRDLSAVLDKTIQLVSKAGQMRALGDVAFALAMTTENYAEARRCYEEAIALDDALREPLQENLASLEKIERTQKARALEEQADLALANNRYREASELYSKAMMNAVVSSGVYLRVREKLESVTKIIALEAACHFVERGEEALKSNSVSTAKDHFSQAFKLNPEFLHIHTILVGIEKQLHQQIVKQKTAEANQALKAFKYKLAEQLLQEAIALEPEESSPLRTVLNDLQPLIQSENALARQRAGQAAMDDKRFPAAVNIFTEAMALLPDNPTTEADKANILCDRAHAYLECKDMHKAIDDCMAALEIRKSHGMAYFRLGAAQYGLDLYDEAAVSYQRAAKLDASLSEQIKVKMRQVNTAKEVEQRKEREAERARAKEEERKLLEEKKVREDLLKKERNEKLAQEKAEKDERARLKEEDRQARVRREQELKLQEAREKEERAEKQRMDKAERDAQKAAERERAKAEKERERERLKEEKERKQAAIAKAQELERIRQQDLAAERERIETRNREIEREKEADRERARLEMERTIAEREKARQEKLQQEKEAKKATEAAAALVQRQKAAEDAAAATAAAATAAATAAMLVPTVAAESLNALKIPSGSSDSGGSGVSSPAPRTPIDASPSAGADKSRLSAAELKQGRKSNKASKLVPGSITIVSKPQPAPALWTGKVPTNVQQPVALVPVSSSGSTGQRGLDTAAAVATNSLHEFPPLSGDAAATASGSDAAGSIISVSSAMGSPAGLKSPFLNASVGESSSHTGSPSPSLASSSLGEAGGSSWNPSLAWLTHQQAQLEASSNLLMETFQQSVSLDDAKLPSPPVLTRSVSGNSSTRSVSGNSSSGGGDCAPVNGSSLSNPASASSSSSSSSSSLAYDPSQVFGEVSLDPTAPTYLGLSAPRNKDFEFQPSAQAMQVAETKRLASLSHSHSPALQPAPTLAGRFDRDVGASSGHGLLGGSLFGGVGGSGGLSSSNSIGLFDGLGTGGGNNSSVFGSNSLGGLGDNNFSGLGFSMSNFLTSPIEHSHGSNQSNPGGFSDYSNFGGYGGGGALDDLGPMDPNDHLLKSIGGLTDSSPVRQNPRHVHGLDGLGGLGFGGQQQLQGAPTSSSVSSLGGGGYGSSLLTGIGGGGSLGGPAADDFLRSSDPLSLSAPPLARSVSAPNALGGGSGFGLGLMGGGIGNGGSYFEGRLQGGSSFDGLFPPAPGSGSLFGASSSAGSFQQQQQQSINSFLRPFPSGSETIGSGGSMQPPYPSLKLSEFAPQGTPQLNLSSQFDSQNGGTSPLSQLGRMASPPLPSPLTVQQPSSSSSSSSSSSTSGGDHLGGASLRNGIDSDALGENVFPSVAWLRRYNMLMYGWTWEQGEWVQYAMHLPTEALQLLHNPPESSKLSEFQQVSQCKMALMKEFLRGREETFLVFYRGTSGQPSNTYMSIALDLISGYMKQVVQGTVPPPSQQPLSAPFSSMDHPSLTRGSSVGNGLEPGLSLSQSTSSSQSFGAGAWGVGAGLGLGQGQSSLLSGGNSSGGYADSDSGSSGLDGFTGTDVDIASFIHKRSHKKRPELLKVAPVTDDYMQRAVEIPRDAVGIIIGHNGKKIKDLCTDSGAKIQFRVNKTAEREGRAGVLEVHGSPENVDRALQAIWDLLQLVGKEFVEIPAGRK